MFPAAMQVTSWSRRSWQDTSSSDVVVFGLVALMLELYAIVVIATAAGDRSSSSSPGASCHDTE